MKEPMSNRKNIFLVAPCGSGKTLAVVYNWLMERPTKHLIYVLPTQTLLKSIEKDVKKILLDLGFKHVLLEEKSFDNSKQICTATDYGERRETTLYAHDIIFTTLDSYISRLYRSALTPMRYRDLPIARIFNSTTVFDEAHMYDSYTHTLMKYTLRLLRGGDSNSQVSAHHIVMTATMNNKMVKFLELDKEIYLKIKVEDKMWMSFVGQKVVSEVISYNTPADFVERVKNLIEQKDIKKAIVVCNTVEKAQKIYDSIKGSMNALLLHSRYKPYDREKKENNITNFLSNENGIIVSTQVLEAGINISTPNLITEVAPGDSLVQRIGRCARWKNEEGQIYLLYSNKEKPHPYNFEVEPIIEMFNKCSNSEYNYDLEKQLIESVVPPELAGEKESKARGIILGAFESLSAFGDTWINVPTRDTTPVYLYLGLGKDVNKDKYIINNSIRVDTRFLRSISKDYSDFKFYEKEYDRDDKELKLREILNPNAWSFAVPKPKIPNIVEYDEEVGVKKI